MAILIEPPEKKPELTGSVIIKDTVVFSSHEDYVLSPKNAETLYFISASPDVTEINFLQKLIIATNTGNIDFIVAKAFLGSTKIYDQLDYPILDLNFALTKSLDPRITFTRASSGSYFDSDGVMQFASTNTPRFDHNPVTKESLGLLIEGQRTNLLTYSQGLDDAVWIKSNATITITTNTVVAPDGALTGDKLVESIGFSGVQIRQDVSVAINQIVTFSCYIKAAERNLFRLTVQNGSSTGDFFRGQFNAESGQFLASASFGVATINSVLITNVGNGWFRASVTGTLGTATGTTTARCFVQVIEINVSIGAGGAYTGNGVSGINIWGVQIESGAFPTSYIPTTVSAATRNADSALISGVNFSSWYNQIKGTILGEYRYLSTGVANQYALSINNNSANESINIITSTPNSGRVIITTGGVSQADFGSFSFSSGQLVKRAIAIASNNTATVVNNGTVATDNTVNLPTPNQFSIGAANYIPGSQINGYIKRIAYWNRRLANTELQLLTT